MIDKFGNCPHCNKSWRGRDILEELKRLSVFSHLNDSGLLDLASRYGYSPQTKGNFSTVNIYFREDGIFYQCPSIRCGHVFNAETGQEFESMWHLKRGKVYEGSKEKINEVEESFTRSGVLAKRDEKERQDLIDDLPF